MEAIHRDMYFLTKFYIWITLSTGQILHSWDQVTACYLNSIKAKIDRKNFVVDKCSHPIATVLIQPHTFSTVQISQQQTSQSETSGKIPLQQPDSWICPHCTVDEINWEGKGLQDEVSQLALNLLLILKFINK